MSADAAAASAGSKASAPASHLARATRVLPFATMVLLVLALQFGPFVGLVGYRLSGAQAWTTIGGLRDLLVAVLVVAGAAAASAAGRGRWPASVRWAVGIVAVDVAIGLASSSAPFLVALNLRRLVLVPVLFAVLWLLPWSPRQIRLLLSLIVSTSVLVALFGLLERTLPATFWTGLMEIERYNAANPVDRFGAIAFDDSGRFFSWDLEGWLHRPVRRLISTYLEPTTLAAGMAAAMLLALARGARGRPSAPAVWLFAACGLLTVSKGFVLFLVALLAWRWTGLPSPRQAFGFALLLVAGAGIAARAGWGEGAAALHVDGLLSSLQYLAQGHLVGEGLGAAGNYTDVDFDIGAESGLGNAIAQVGLAALLPLAWAGTLAREVMATAAARRDPGGTWLAGWVLFWLLSYLLSASSLGAGGNALGFAALALYLHPSASKLHR